MVCWGPPNSQPFEFYGRSRPRVCGNDGGTVYGGTRVKFLGFEQEGPVEVCTDNKAAYDLCHRFASAQHTRHIDRKLFKMRELRGAGIVSVKLIPTETNPADLFTKVLSRQLFERHRATTLNLAGASDHAERESHDGDSRRAGGVA